MNNIFHGVSQASNHSHCSRPASSFLALVHWLDPAAVVALVVSRTKEVPLALATGSHQWIMELSQAGMTCCVIFVFSSVWSPHFGLTCIVPQLCFAASYFGWPWLQRSFHGVRFLPRRHLVLGKCPVSSLATTSVLTRLDIGMQTARPGRDSYPSSPAPE